MEKLNPLQVPLTGSTLIEASAGTGKTYTITTLFLRLLLEKKLAVDRILVVTFTIAATEELRIKIRDRIGDAIAWLNGNISDDETLERLLSSYNKAETLVLLEDVAARLDELAVYTIDAMCLRVLKDFAFESKLPMRMEFIANDNHIKRLITEDYWRHVIGGKDFLATDEISSYGSPEILLETLHPLLQLRDAVVVPAVERAEVDQLRRSLNKLYFRLSALWEKEQPDLVSVLKNERAVLKKNMYKPASVETLVAELQQLFSVESFPTLLPDKFNLVTQSYIGRAIRKNQPLPEHLFFKLCDEFSESFERFGALRRAIVLCEARDYIANGVDRYKRDYGLLHFEDLRVRLCDALTSQDGDVLSAKIRELWPFAMIDESQDTDPQQNSIFQSVYKNQPNCGLFYIGDPKQAIYSFRGADVFTYMKAAQSFDRRYTLGINWRSSTKLVNAFNALFMYKPNAFLFNDDISYSTVEAAGFVDNTALKLDQKDIVPLQFRTLDAPNDKPMSADNALTEAAAGCAVEIAELLNSGTGGAAVLGDKKLQASDIAVLVRSHKESRYIQHALQQVGVKSASTTSETVFASVEAQQLLAVLAAISRPGADVIRSALIMEVIGYSAVDIGKLNASEQLWDQIINDFMSYREIWIAKGLMAAVQSLFINMEVATRVLAHAGGERRLTNLIQLTELLQIRSREMSSTDELVNWFEYQMTYPAVDDEQLLRLESDENLVQIVTVHKSKGLEYPVVFLPFGWAINFQKQRKLPNVVVCHRRSDFKSHVDLGSDEKAQNHLLYLEEELSESLRLLYVAITRAKFYCVIGFGSVGYNYPALGYLLNRSEDHPIVSDLKLPEPSDLAQQLAAFAAPARECITIAPWAMSATEPVALAATQTNAQPLKKADFSGAIDRTWRITSYTGLQSAEDTWLPDRDHTDIEISNETQDPSEHLGAIARLPAGARTGQLLHELYETTDFTETSDLKKRIADVVSRYGSLGGAEDWQPVLETIFTNSIEAVLDDESGLRLRDIPNTERVNEMEFFFSLKQAGAKSLQNVLHRYEQYSDTASGLNFQNLNGLMRGFIDMVGRANDRYFIVDYKSNLLGASRDHYQREQLGKTIRSHKYDLQYLIYTVALHRYLKSRLGQKYNYEEHVLGVFYLFVRGMSVQGNAGIWFDKPPLALIEQLNNCFDSGQR